MKRSNEETKSLKTTITTLETAVEKYRTQNIAASQLFENVLTGENQIGESLRKEWKNESLKVGKWTVASGSLEEKMSFAMKQIQSVVSLREKLETLETENVALREKVVALEVELPRLQEESIKTKKLQAEMEAMEKIKEEALQHSLTAKRESEVLRKGQETDIGQIFALQLKMEAMQKESDDKVAQFHQKLESLVIESVGLKEKDIINTKNIETLTLSLNEKTDQIERLTTQMKVAEEEYQLTLAECEEEIESLNEQMQFASPFTESKGGPEQDQRITYHEKQFTMTLSSVFFMICLILVLVFLFVDVSELKRLKLF